LASTDPRRNCTISRRAFSSVLIGKNLSALLFIVMEILAVTAVCALLGMPLNPLKLAEAFAVREL